MWYLPQWWRKQPVTLSPSQMMGFTYLVATSLVVQQQGIRPPSFQILASYELYLHKPHTLLFPNQLNDHVAYYYTNTIPVTITMHIESKFHLGFHHTYHRTIIMALKPIELPSFDR